MIYIAWFNKVAVPPWSRYIPFGVPVVPDVYKIYNGWLDYRCTGENDPPDFSTSIKSWKFFIFFDIVLGWISLSYIITGISLLLAILHASTIIYS